MKLRYQISRYSKGTQLSRYISMSSNSPTYWGALFAGRGEPSVLGFLHCWKLLHTICSHVEQQERDETLENQSVVFWVPPRGGDQKGDCSLSGPLLEHKRRACLLTSPQSQQTFPPCCSSPVFFTSVSLQGRVYCPSALLWMFIGCRFQGYWVIWPTGRLALVLCIFAYLIGIVTTGGGRDIGERGREGAPFPII